MDLEAFRNVSRQTWDKMASGWEARHEWLEANVGVVNDWLIEQVDPEPGQVVLDVAAGPGDLGHRVAPRVGPEGRVISTDFAPEMVDVARRLGAARGLDNVEYRMLDAEQMALDDDSVDAVLCRFGYMLMGDPGAALRESRRVERPGGALAFAVFTDAAENPWAALPARILVERGHIPPPEPGAPGVFSMADPDRIRELVTAASFADPEIEPVEFTFRYADEADAWNAIVDLNGPLAMVINGLQAEERDATRSVVLDSFASFRSLDGSFSIPARVWGVHAR